MKTSNTISITEIPETAIQVILTRIEAFAKNPDARFKDFQQYKPLPYKVKNFYFAGRTLCIDITDGKTADVITLSQDSETFGLVTGGCRRLLSIKSLKSLESIMAISGINHKPKWLIPNKVTQTYNIQSN